MGPSAARLGIAFAEHDAADFDGADSRVPVQGAYDGLPGELPARQVRAERRGVEIDRMPAQRLDNLHARPHQPLAEILDAPQPILQIILV